MGYGHLPMLPVRARILGTMDFCAPDHPGSTPWPPNWQRPQWPAPAKVRAFCTSRTGGVSVAPYDSMNLGQNVGDRPEAVAANRTVFLNQVHGCEVVALTHAHTDGAQADGSWTAAQGLACTVLVADCLPLLLCTTDGSHVAALHAGWRGLAGAQPPGVARSETAVIETFLNAQAALGRGPACWMAWLGPCIGPQVFEVGNEVREAFLPGSPSAALAFVPQVRGKWLADLALLARQRLRFAGVTEVYGNDSSASWCTVGNPLRFFSHRRDRVSGRFAAGIWLA